MGLLGGVAPSGGEGFVLDTVGANLILMPGH